MLDKSLEFKSMITYRVSIFEDRYAINELVIEMFNTIYNTKDSKGYSLEEFNRFYEGNGSYIEVALDGDRIIGFLSIEEHKEDTHFLYLDDFSVYKEYRGQGIGAQLIQNAIHYASLKKIHIIFLHVEQENKRALGYYERLGFTICEQQDSRYKMILQLKEK